MPIIKALFVPAILAVSATAAAAASGPECGQAGSHAEERTCYEKAFQASLAELRQAEGKFLESLQAWDVEPNYKQNTKAKFLVASKQFAAFRAVQCEVAASLAAGGNGAGDLRLSCLVEVTRGQIAAIQAWSASLK